MNPHCLTPEMCSKIDYLSLADPKALQYILHTSGYRFPKGREANQIIKLMVGPGLGWAHGTLVLVLPRLHYNQ